jgi:NlpC/P60 family
MAIRGASVAYCVVGGLVAYSGIKGASLSDTVKAVLSGNLSLSDTESIGSGSSASSGGSANGASILADAQQYNGHKYVYGGPSNPATGWDCSSFVSYVLGHDENLPIPGGTWTAVTGNGADHGPTADAYLTWSGATTVAASAVQPGDLLCWPTHVGFAVSATEMFSAYDTASGTVQTGWTGPSGEGNPVVRSVNGASTATAGGSTSNSAFAAALLTAMNAPQSTQNLSSLNGWFAREGTKAAFNPLATTYVESGSTIFNSDGVQNYTSQAQGVAATVATLENGLYPAIVMALQAGQGLAAGNGQVQQELLTWSGGGYSSV